MPKLHLDCQIKAKADGEMTFTAYGNVKNVVDHALDVAMDGCYKSSIARHKSNGTMPKLFWSHDPRQLPVGVIKDLEEDSHGLHFDGKLSKTTMGKDLHVLALDGGIDSFSIGYTINQERWNSEKGYNELIEIDVHEISFVNFACNEDSLLQDIKTHLRDGELPTKRELENLLRDNGLSRKQAMTIAAQYNPVLEQTLTKSDIKDLALFND